MFRRLAAAAAVMLTVAGCGGSSGDVSTLAEVHSFIDLRSSPLGPATQSVTETDGSTWKFDQAPTGRITLLYFGYTHCPDICPTTMADLAVALRGLPASIRDKIAVQFVTTDPRRDTRSQIRGWLNGFNRSFAGGRATIANVIAAARVYGIGISPPVVSKGDYQVTHGAELVVFKPGGADIGYFQELAGRSAYARVLPVLVNEYA